MHLLQVSVFEDKNSRLSEGIYAGKEPAHVSCPLWEFPLTPALNFRSIVTLQSLPRPCLSVMKSGLHNQAYAVL